MVDAERKHLLVVADEQSLGGQRVMLDGVPVPGTPDQVLASLWEQGWVRTTLWMRTEYGTQGTREVLHEVHLVRSRGA